MSKRQFHLVEKVQFREEKEIIIHLQMQGIGHYPLILRHKT
mgnify:CR=1 FL=1